MEVTDPSRDGKTSRSPDALKARARPGNEGRAVTEDKTPAGELGQRIVRERMVTSRTKTPFGMGPPGSLALSPAPAEPQTEKAQSSGTALDATTSSSPQGLSSLYKTRSCS